MALAVRRIAEDEYERWGLVPTAGFSEIAPPERRAQWRARTEMDRLSAAIDDDEMVGSVGAFTFETRVPGGALLPTCGVTAVAVLPTHRRRGVLSAMMRHQIEDARDRGEPLASLWASESVIYGRFGYGVAIPGERWRIDRARGEFAQPAATETGGRVQLVDRASALERFPAIYERALAMSTGMLGVRAGWWEANYGPGEWETAAIGDEPFLAVYERDGVDEGYVTYKVSGWSSDGRDLTVQHLYATTTEAHEALWRYVFGVDLVDRIHASKRAIDDPLPWMLADPRRLERRVGDMIWLRLVDVDQALGARTYSAAGRLTIEVRDDFCGWNEGTYLLEAQTDGSATCERVRDNADLALSVDALGATYLGGVSFATLRQAGRIEELRSGAVSTADGMFRTERAPWCALDF